MSALLLILALGACEAVDTLWECGDTATADAETAITAYASPVLVTTPGSGTTATTVTVLVSPQVCGVSRVYVDGVAAMPNTDASAWTAAIPWVQLQAEARAVDPTAAYVDLLLPVRVEAAVGGESPPDVSVRVYPYGYVPDEAPTLAATYAFADYTTTTRTAAVTVLDSDLTSCGQSVTLRAAVGAFTEAPLLAPTASGDACTATATYTPKATGTDTVVAAVGKAVSTGLELSVRGVPAFVPATATVSPGSDLALSPSWSGGAQVSCTWTAGADGFTVVDGGAFIAAGVAFAPVPGRAVVVTASSRLASQLTINCVDEYAQTGGAAVTVNSTDTWTPECAEWSLLPLYPTGLDGQTVSYVKSSAATILQLVCRGDDEACGHTATFSMGSGSPASASAALVPVADACVAEVPWTSPSSSQDVLLYAQLGTGGVLGEVSVVGAPSLLPGDTTAQTDSVVDLYASSAGGELFACYTSATSTGWTLLINGAPGAATGSVALGGEASATISVRVGSAGVLSIQCVDRLGQATSTVRVTAP